MAGKAATGGLSSMGLEILKDNVLRAVKRENAERARNELEEILFETEETPELSVIKTAIENEQFERAYGAIAVLLAGTYYELDQSDGENQ